MQISHRGIFEAQPEGNLFEGRDCASMLLGKEGDDAGSESEGEEGSFFKEEIAKGGWWMVDGNGNW